MTTSGGRGIGCAGWIVVVCIVLLTAWVTAPLWLAAILYVLLLMEGGV